MKKRDRSKRHDNIILFPNLEKRLVEKGLQYLKEKNWKEAIVLLEDALAWNYRHDEIYIGLVIAYFEYGNLQKAKQLAEIMLQEEIGDNLQTVDLYFMILVQLHDYDKIVTMIDKMLQEEEIPESKLEHFEKILQLSKKMLKDAAVISSDTAEHESHVHKKLGLLGKNAAEQMLLVKKLEKEKIQPYIVEVKEYLTSIEGNVFVKTLLLHVLKEQQYEQPVKVEKLAQKGIVMPAHLKEVTQQEQFLQLASTLRVFLENEDPIMLEHAKEFIEQQFLILYPFQFEKYPVPVYAAAYYFVINEYFGKTAEAEEVAGKFKVAVGDMKQAIKKIHSLEQISFRDMQLHS
ncbi:tetratricopeptide repeat protein [Bacillaceae bacterium Marseille-Q3522]|nr:tetratricopeptide repeat protein [Bacillaceae bacterium Marseille-Q3522]